MLLAKICYPASGFIGPSRRPLTRLPEPHCLGSRIPVARRASATLRAPCSNRYALSQWRTGCRLLGKLLGDLTRGRGKPLVKPHSGREGAEIAPRRSPVRVRLAPSKPPEIGGFPVGEERLAKHPGARSTRCTQVPEMHRNTASASASRHRLEQIVGGTRGLTRNAQLPTRAQQSLTRASARMRAGPPTR